jgi:hypothetical protein
MEINIYNNSLAIVLSSSHITPSPISLSRALAVAELAAGPSQPWQEPLLRPAQSSRHAIEPGGARGCRGGVPRGSGMRGGGGACGARAVAELAAPARAAAALLAAAAQTRPRARWHSHR